MMYRLFLRAALTLLCAIGIAGPLPAQVVKPAPVGPGNKLVPPAAPKNLAAQNQALGPMKPPAAPLQVVKAPGQPVGGMMQGVRAGGGAVQMGGQKGIGGQVSALAKGGLHGKDLANMIHQMKGKGGQGMGQGGGQGIGQGGGQGKGQGGGQGKGQGAQKGKGGQGMGQAGGGQGMGQAGGQAMAKGGPKGKGGGQGMGQAGGQGGGQAMAKGGGQAMPKGGGGQMMPKGGGQAGNPVGMVGGKGGNRPANGGGFKPKGK